MAVVYRLEFLWRSVNASPMVYMWDVVCAWAMASRWGEAFEMA
jgi:hypothetical protein